MNGVLVINKEMGYTSFDVIRILRKLFMQKKMGHSGTLDPNAEGVLPVFLGQATKLCDALPDQTKEYRAEMTLGLSTDTEDIWGNPVESSEVNITEEVVREAVLSFEGTYDQVPPMYSAKKINGQKLYDLARKGETVERKAVPVTLDRIYDIEVELPKVRFTVSCSKGTYIRTLCVDIGKKLGLPACMSRLVRVRHGQFVQERSYTIKEVEEAVKEGRGQSLFYSLESFFADLPVIALNEEGYKALHNGNILSGKHVVSAIPTEGRFRIFDENGSFRAVYRYDAEKDGLVPVHMFEV